MRQQVCGVILGIVVTAGPGVPVAAIDPLPSQFSRLVGTSDLAVLGTISEVRDDAFEVIVDGTLVGSAPAGALTVAKAPRWPDEPRWAPYGAGQQLVLLLVRTANAGAPEWKVNGILGRGELPVEAGQVFFAEPVLNGIEVRRYHVHGAEIEAQRVAASELFCAIRQYSRCFTWAAVGEGERAVPRRLCDDRALAAYRSRSLFHAHLADESLSAIRGSG